MHIKVSLVHAFAMQRLQCACFSLSPTCNAQFSCTLVCISMHVYARICSLTVICSWRICWNFIQWLWWIKSKIRKSPSLASTNKSLFSVHSWFRLQVRICNQLANETINRKSLPKRFKFILAEMCAQTLLLFLLLIWLHCTLHVMHEISSMFTDTRRHTHSLTHWMLKM